MVIGPSNLSSHLTPLVNRAHEIIFALLYIFHIGWYDTICWWQREAIPVHSPWSCFALFHYLNCTNENNHNIIFVQSIASILSFFPSVLVGCTNPMSLLRSHDLSDECVLILCLVTAIYLHVNYLAKPWSILIGFSLMPGDISCPKLDLNINLGKFIKTYINMCAL